MDPAEKIARHAKLYKVVTTHTSHTWAAVLVKMLLGQMGLQGMARQTPYIPKGKLEEMYVKAKKRLFLFDYDVCFFLFFISSFRFIFFFNRLSLGCLSSHIFLGNSFSDCQSPLSSRSIRSSSGSA